MVLTHDQVCARIEREIELAGSLRRTAAALGVSYQYLSDVLIGKCGIGPKLLEALNLKRTVVKDVVYEPVRKAGR